MALVLTIHEDKEIVLETSDGNVVIHWSPDRQVGAKLSFEAPRTINIFRRKRKDFTRE